MLVELLGGIVVGCVGGFASGLLGITSGGILVPLLVLLIGQEQHVAQGVSLVAQVVPTSLSGLRGYRRAGHTAPLRWISWLAGGFAAGGCVGALLATQISETALQWTFVGYLAILLALVVLRPPGRAAAAADTANDQLHRTPLITIGAVAGWSSGFLGIGGGLAIIALMTGLLKQSQHRSQAISLAVTALPVTLPAAVLYVQQGTDLPWLTIGGVIAGLWLGTVAGSATANRISPPRLRALLIALLAVMAILMGLRASG
jgi:uncharacterized membrane protein YfcA